MKRPLIRIVLIDDHEMVRQGLRAFLERENDFTIVGEAGTAADAIPLVERLHPHVVLLDLHLPDATGVDICRKLHASTPHTRILVLTGHAEDATVIAALQNGAHGYLLKDVRLEELLRAVRTVADGRGYLDPRVTQKTLDWVRSGALASPFANGLAKLSKQERLIMPLLAEGKTNKEIAAHLCLSDKTVKNYIANIFFKIQVKRRAEAVAWFIKENRVPYATATPPVQPVQNDT
ncbi:response regulator [Candidatus Nitrospira inopinata]|jgi:DNA-binding NarL/FixJ family response regulator|uniref:Putative NarL family two-component system response regulator n=1 Tax=Candidatus Nitrospira inopinata TaxID=1715989 RepID=A0A0S4KVG5_9BACT|nr:response regulator transcription factor [Candidatus Nitrospira inopinata]CUQ66331.1 putative NarL family two-component system response regulator [Candidatus Nitrospira inopinata]